jgi:hypothetical protein
MVQYAQFVTEGMGLVKKLKEAQICPYLKKNNPNGTLTMITFLSKLFFCLT